MDTPRSGGDLSITYRTDVTDSCLHKWGYRLARSSDPVHEVAEAVIGACWDTIFPLAYAKDYQRRLDKVSEPGFLSVKKGNLTNAFDATYEELRAKAQFRVVQARAGGCKVP